MKPHGNNWTVGELVTLPREEKLLKKSGAKSYSRYIGSRYICIRQATDGQLHTAHDDSEHYRITFVCFYKGRLDW